MRNAIAVSRDVGCQVPRRLADLLLTDGAGNGRAQQVIDGLLADERRDRRHKPYEQPLKLAVGIVGVPTWESERTCVEGAPLRFGNAQRSVLPPSEQKVARSPAHNGQNAILEQLDELLHHLEDLELLQHAAEVGRLQREDIAGDDLETGNLLFEVGKIDINLGRWRV